MWIYGVGGSFLSIVQDKLRPGYLLVRARATEEIESIFPNVTVTTGGGTDYLYRASIHVDEVADAIAWQIRVIDYNNFKDSISDRKTHDTLFKVWLNTKELQPS